MADEMACRLLPEPGTDPSDVIRMYTAMRSGDVARVETILDSLALDLVHAPEDLTWGSGSPPAALDVRRRNPAAAGGGSGATPTWCASCSPAAPTLMAPARARAASVRCGWRCCSGRPRSSTSCWRTGPIRTRRRSPARPLRSPGGGATTSWPPACWRPAPSSRRRPASSDDAPTARHGHRHQGHRPVVSAPHAVAWST